MKAPATDQPPTLSCQNQRTPSLFAPSGAQLARLRRLLSGDEAAVGQKLAATMVWLAYRATQARAKPAEGPADSRFAPPARRAG